MEDIYSSENLIHDENQINELVNKPTDQLTPSEKIEVLIEKFRIQRVDWENKLKVLIENLRNVDKLTECQINMLSYRQIIIELITQYRIRLRAIKSKYDIEYKKKFIQYFNYDYKINDKHKIQMVEADLHLYLTQINVFETQIEHFKECVSTLDKLGFAIKNRINIEEL